MSTSDFVIVGDANLIGYAIASRLDHIPGVVICDAPSAATPGYPLDDLMRLVPTHTLELQCHQEPAQELLAIRNPTRKWKRSGGKGKKQRLR